MTQEYKKLALTAFFTFFLLISTRLVQADDNMQTSNVNDSQATASAMMPVVKYDLAYPGLLPDNPLYKLKVLRDKIEAAFISDPRQKAEFYLLEADKGILASAILVDKNELKLAETTALKAENNMTLLANNFNQLSIKSNDNFFKKIETASAKHQEVLESLAKRTSGSDRQAFEQVVDFSKRNLSTIDGFKDQHDLPFSQ